MLKDIINNYCDAMSEGILSSKDSNIVKGLKMLYKAVGEENGKSILRALFVPAIPNEITSMATVKEFSEEAIAEAIAEELKAFAKQAKGLVSLYKIEVKLGGLEEYCSRTILVPTTIPLNLLCYAVMGSFGAGLGHPFYMEYKKERFHCLALLEDESNYVLNELHTPELGLKKNSKFDVVYDMGDFFEFHCCVKEIVKLDRIIEPSDFSVVEARGMHIWEDNRYLMDLYYHDLEQYKAFLEHEGIEYVDPKELDENVSLEEINESFIDTIREIYQVQESVY